MRACSSTRSRSPGILSRNQFTRRDLRRDRRCVILIRARQHTRDKFGRAGSVARCTHATHARPRKRFERFVPANCEPSIIRRKTSTEKRSELIAPRATKFDSIREIAKRSLLSSLASPALLLRHRSLPSFSLSLFAFLFLCLPPPLSLSSYPRRRYLRDLSVAGQ